MTGKSSTTNGALLVPFVLLSLAFLGWMALQTVQLLGGREALATRLSQQQDALAVAYKTRQAADSLSPKVLALANKGNFIAQQVVAALKQQGITVNPNAVTQEPPP